MPFCPICSSELEETQATTLKCPKAGEHSRGDLIIGSAMLECPHKKGAIWAYITDDSGKGLGKILVTASGAPTPTKPTEPSGFSSFDPLEPGDHTVSIEIPSEMKDQFYPPSKTVVPGVPVRNGEITSVQFKLERIAPLKVSVEHPENFPGKLGIKAVGSASEFNPSGSVEGKGFLTFPKLRKHQYDVTFTLDEDQKKLFMIEGSGAQTWRHNPYQENEVKFKVIALKLLSLEVIAGAADLTGGHYWCVADSVKKVRVKAVTDPDEKAAWKQLKWVGATATGDGNEALVDITDTGDFEVKATLDVPKSVTVEVYDLVKLDCLLPDHLGGTRWKAWNSNKVTRLKATTKPNEERVWKHLVWSEGAPTSTVQESDVELKPVGDRTVTVSLSGKPLPVDLHICEWPILKIHWVSFGGFNVLNDGAADFGNAFDKMWKKGRPDPAPHVDAASCQSPLCFIKATTFQADAWFKVEVAPLKPRPSRFAELAISAN